MALRFGFVGFRHGHIHSLYKKILATSGTEVVAAGEDDAAARAEAKAQGVAITHESTGDLIANADCDVIAIGDYYARRGSLAIAALKAGKHAIADKPLCTSLDELDEMARLSQEKNLKGSCMLTMRGSGQINGLRKLILDGAIGAVHAISFGGQHPLNLGSRPKWYFEPGKHGGTINDIGIHAIDAIPWMTGLKFEVVNAARCWNAFAPEFPHFKDGAQMMLTMSNGCGVLGDVSYFMPDKGGYSLPYYWRMTVWGRNGVLETAATVDVIHRTVDGALKEEPLARAQEGYFEQFVKDVRGEEVELNTAAVIASSRLTLKIQQAADEGWREVRLL